MTIGVLAVQGAFAAHARIFESLGVATRLIRQPAHLADVNALVFPGGESTTMSNVLLSTGLFDPINEMLASGTPAFGTCAGLILLSSVIDAGRDDQRCFSAMDCEVLRNGYGRQINSFESELDVDGLDSPFPAVFIRAPKIVALGDSVEVFASVEGQPVYVRQQHVWGTTFHPELTSDHRIHQRFVNHL